ncbi:MAG TPA: hypothetical protein DD727_02390 [Clostridiales bacterium]|nr:hypothetical protein [Clostridiales bacterium]
MRRLMRTLSISTLDFKFSMSRVLLQRDFEDHLHEHAEMILVVGGTAIHSVNGKGYPMRTGDVAVVHRGNFHGFRRVADLENYNIGFLPEMLYAAGEEVRRIPGFHSLFISGTAGAAEASAPGSALPAMHLDPDDLVRGIELAENIREELAQRRDGFEVLVRSRFIELIVFLARKFAESASRNEGILRLSHAVSHMEKYFNENIGMEELAGMAGISERHFTRLFRQVYGASPGEYLLNLRIRYALELLRHTDKTVTQTALDSGFYDCSSFVKYFRRIMNTTPSRYRKNPGKLDVPPPGGLNGRPTTVVR